jgi:hypothetical protein
MYVQKLSDTHTYIVNTIYVYMPSMNRVAYSERGRSRDKNTISSTDHCSRTLRRRKPKFSTKVKTTRKKTNSSRRQKEFSRITEVLKQKLHRMKDRIASSQTVKDTMLELKNALRDKIALR